MAQAIVLENNNALNTFESPKVENVITYLEELENKHKFIIQTLCDSNDIFRDQSTGSPESTLQWYVKGLTLTKIEKPMFDKLVHKMAKYAPKMVKCLRNWNFEDFGFYLLSIEDTNIFKDLKS